MKTLLILLLFIPISTITHYLLFPQETRCILIVFSNFKKDGRLYFNPNNSQTTFDTVESLIRQASVRVAAFWGQETCNPTFIYCDSDKDFKKYGSPHSVPAVTQLKLGSYIVLSKEGADLDIIAHEISHAELYERIGFYKMTFKIPSWFKHGLAMQNDFRNYYSEDTLKMKSDNFRNLPQLKYLETDKQFYKGNLSQIMLNYMTAKHEIKNWYTKEKLDRLIKDLNAGKSFTEAYGNPPS
jgi:hypothetical protein